MIEHGSSSTYPTEVLVDVLLGETLRLGRTAASSRVKHAGIRRRRILEEVISVLADVQSIAAVRGGASNRSIQDTDVEVCELVNLHMRPYVLAFPNYSALAPVNTRLDSDGDLDAARVCDARIDEFAGQETPDRSGEYDVRVDVSLGVTAQNEKIDVAVVGGVWKRVQNRAVAIVV